MTNFLRQAAKVFPYPINIISGQTEAKTIYAGVCHTQPEKRQKACYRYWWRLDRNDYRR